GRGHRPLVLAGDLALGRDRLSSAYAVLHHHARIGGQRRQIRALDRGVEDAAGLAGGQRHGRPRRERYVGIVARRAVGLLESRFLAWRPRLDRAELLPHGIDAEIEPRRAQRWIHVRARKGEAADRSDGGRAAGLAVSALVGWRARGRPWRRRLLRLGCGLCGVDRRITRQRLPGLLLRERWALRLRIRHDFSRRRRLEPIALERNQAIVAARDAVVALAAAVHHRTRIGAREKGLFAQEPLADRPGDARVVRI